MPESFGELASLKIFTDRQQISHLIVSEFKLVN